MSLMGAVQVQKTVAMGGMKRRLSDAELDAEIKGLEKRRNGEDTDLEEGDDTAPAKKTTKDKEEDSEEGTWKERYANLRRHSQTQVVELQKQIDALSKGAGPKAPKTPEEIKAWKEKYAESYDYVRSVIMEELEVNSSVDKVQKLEIDLIKQKTIAKLAKVHSDFEEVRASPEWADWLDGISSKRKMLIENEYEDASVLIEAVTDFKKAVKWSKKGKDVDPPRDVTTRRNAPTNSRENEEWSESKVASLTDAEYDKYADAIDESRRDGTFVYDLNKKPPRY